MLRSRLALALVAALPAVAPAQFTTYVPPASRIDSARAAVVAEQKAQTDSITHTALTNMKAWVDSAAGVAPTTTDTMAAATADESATSFGNGAVAPNTASPLPLIALIGLAALSIGTVMLAGRDRA